MNQRKRIMGEDREHQDELTGLLNAAGFSDVVSNALQLHNTDSSVLFLDLSNFKAFNAKHGRFAGDQLLKHTAAILQSLYPSCPCARLGEDHFTLLCPSVQAEIIANRLNEELEKFAPGENVVAKAGCAACEKGTDNLAVTERARIACESIKHIYGASFCMYDPSMLKDMLRRKYILDHVQEAIDKDWIHPYYQPIVRTITGRVCAVESLARWIEDDGTFLRPDQFIDLLEEARMISMVDLHIAKDVCRDLRSRLDRHLPVVPVSINLSRLDFMDQTVFEQLNDILEEYHINHDLIDVEVTERVLNTDDGSLYANIEQYRKAGYEIWMDDFGSGYSSLNVLKDFSFDVIKIDMKFLNARNEKAARRSRMIVANIINMAKQLGIRTLCEGVETEAYQKALARDGCEMLQGYYYAKPLPLAQLEKTEFVFENKAERGYMQATGRINLLSPDPLLDAQDTMIPTVLAEMGPDGMRIVQSNPGFQDFIQSAGFKDTNEMLEPRFTRVREQIADAVRRSFDAKQKVSFDVLLNARYISITIQSIACNQEDGRCTFVARLSDLSQLTGIGNFNLRDKVTNSLCSIFERIDMFDLDHDVVRTIYQDNSMYRGKYDGETNENAVLGFAQLNVYPNDRADFIKTYDFKGIQERIYKSGMRYEAGFFRSLDANGNYRLQIYVLIPAVVDGTNVLLSCSVSASDAFISIADKMMDHGTILHARVTQDASSFARITDNDVESMKDAEIRTFFDNAKIGIFWKDINRRFIDGNAFFRDYYGFTQSSDFVGKTDEEMGWHVNPDPFKNDEYRVLHYGEQINGAMGTCISHGKIRQIMAYKAPIYRNGNIVGLVGYFVDLSMLASGNKKVRQIHQDSVTGLLDRRGLYDAFCHYQDAWKKEHRDFALMYLQIENMQAINQKYGYQKADEILKSIGDHLVDLLGQDSAIGRLNAGNFLVIQQMDGEDELKNTLRRIGSSASVNPDLSSQQDLSISGFLFGSLSKEESQGLISRGLESTDMINKAENAD